MLPIVKKMIRNMLLKKLINKIFLDPEKSSLKDLEIISSEIKVHQKLNHKNIIKLYNYIWKDNKVYLILEYAENGNLFQFLKLKNPSQEKLERIYYKICKAVQVMHHQKLLHRDIKPENILLDKDFEPKLSDFGWSTILKKNQFRITFCGTFEYMAPEILESKVYDFGVDLWSLGILLYEMLNGESPFEGENIVEIYKKIVKKQILMKIDMKPKAGDLILSLLKHNSKDRLNIDEVLKSPFLIDIKKKIEMEKIENKKKHLRNSENLKTKINKNKEKSKKLIKEELKKKFPYNEVKELPLKRKNINKLKLKVNKLVPKPEKERIEDMKTDYFKKLNSNIYSRKKQRSNIKAISSLNNLSCLNRIEQNDINKNTSFDYNYYNDEKSVEKLIDFNHQKKYTIYDVKKKKKFSINFKSGRKNLNPQTPKNLVLKNSERLFDKYKNKNTSPSHLYQKISKNKKISFSSKIENNMKLAKSHQQFKIYDFGKTVKNRFYRDSEKIHFSNEISGLKKRKNFLIKN